ncbi:YnfC family lipoprotein [Providencia alcalifaciens]|uniref:YnfC family lipoprotein n=1 Tax=Providencia alcalifaciens TaxID=126385 RepID=UPI002B05EC02|nr:YnfC family lipoprotein [Providencia alcalifaciens]
MNIKFLSLASSITTFFLPFQAGAVPMDKYNPVVFNMAQLYDFNPVKGNVKHVKSVVYNEDGSINYESDLKIAKDGCIESFSMTRTKDEYINSVHNELSVKREKNKLIGQDSNGPVEMEVGNNCLILSKKDSDGKLTYQYNADGFINSSWVAEPKTKLSAFHYDENNRSYNVAYYNDNKLFSDISVRYTSDETKPYDLILEVKVLDQSVLAVDTQCEYNQQGVSHKCQFVLTLISDGKQITLKKRSTTDASFY